MFKQIRTFGLLVIVLAIFGCKPASEEQQASTTEKIAAPKVTKAVAVLQPTEGNTVKGTVTFTQEDGGVRVTANFERLTEGDHGFHIHEKGDCSSPDGKSAGGHFNPEGVDHAGPDAEKRHVGDLGNLSASADGTASLDVLDKVISLNGPNTIVGRGVIVHANPDDLTSQPTGNAGGRVACGVIEIAKE